MILFWFTIMAENDLTSLKTITGSLPENISGWKKSSTEGYYTPENLFEYINGNAELFISYDFRNLITLTYNKDESTEITVDIFDMGNPANAYGVFSHSRENEDKFISDEIGSEYGGGLLTFWKGRFYISILVYPETEERKEIVRNISKRISELIRGKNTKPDILSLLPTKNLSLFSIRYFYHHIWLNSHFYISGENILNLGKDTEAVLAKYYPDKEDKTPTIFLLINYSDPGNAERALQSFLKNYLHDSENGFARLSNGRWAGIEQNGKMITIILNAPDRVYAAALLKKVEYK